MNSIRACKFDALYFWAALVCLSSTPVVTNGQTEALRQYRGDDIQVQVDQNWTPVNSGGYFPVIMTIKNRGPDTSIRVYSKDDTPVAYAGGVFAPTVEKRFELAQNATTRMTFLLPVVSMSSNT